MKPADKTFRDVIEMWPSREELAEDVGISYQGVSKWVYRKEIPPSIWPELVAAAIRRGYPVTFDSLNAIRNARK